MELDIEDFDGLREYLTQRDHIEAGEQIVFEKLMGGVSNRTVKVTWSDGHAWVLKQALAKLRVDADWFSSPARIEIEAKALRWLNKMAPGGTTPTFMFEDKANHLMGMEAIPEKHENWKDILLSGQVVSAHFQQFGALLGTIHRRSSESASETSQEFADTTYFENLRLDPYYLYTADQIPEAAQFLTALAKETLQHKDSLVHGDFSPKNTLIYRDKLILLDYEVVHYGDPAFDAGFALTHFLSKAHHLPKERSRIANATSLFWRTYQEEVVAQPWAGRLGPRAVRHTLACLLARVAGKSPLEYLTIKERARQRDIVLALLANPPSSVPELIRDFVQEIETYAEN
jgi:aminoglycoside phosphotransferase (APT) family kinase protein